MTITSEDKRNFEDFISEALHQPGRAEATLKIFYNIVEKFSAVTPKQAEILDLFMNSKYGLDTEVYSKGLKEISAALLSIAEADTGKTYSTGQLAKIFGVSITTINNWIKAGRFVGFHRGKENQQARISEYTQWIDPTGKRMTVGEIFADYDKNNELFLGPTSETRHLDRIRYVVETIDFFEKQYGDSYEVIRSQKGEPSSSEDFKWSREGSEWGSLLREIGDL